MDENNQFTEYKIRQICCFCEFEELKKIPTEKLIILKKELIDCMYYKDREIQIWEDESANQDEETLHDFTERRNGINQCIKYLQNL